MTLGHPARRTIGAFLQVSLDGYYCDPAGDMRFAHKPPEDTEWNTFVAGNASGNGALLFGRVTYEMMAAWWPTPMAAAAMPAVAAGMNAMPKYVFSRTLSHAAWANTTLLRGSLPDAIRRLTAEPGPDLVVLGSGSIVTQLADAGLLDTLQVVICPVALGAGKSLFGGLGRPAHLTLTQSRVFANGSVVLWYEPRR